MVLGSHSEITLKNILICASVVYLLRSTWVTGCRAGHEAMVPADIFWLLFLLGCCQRFAVVWFLAAVVPQDGVVRLEALQDRFGELMQAVV